MKKEIVDILKCPITGSNLHLLNKDELEKVNEKVKNKTLNYLNGTVVVKPFEIALSNENNKFIYAVVDDIIILRKDKAIAANNSIENIDLRSEKRDVENFYDNIGWKHFDDEHFVDAEKFEDLRPLAFDYFTNCNNRVKKYIKQQGKFILDAGSGPIQYDGYLVYSEDYEYRICVDLSIASLIEAKNKLGNKGIYILGDITNLPLKDNVLDAAIALNAIYHIPMDEQAKALNEINRALKPGNTAAIVYTWGDKHSLFMNIGLIYIKVWMAFQKIGRLLKKVLEKLKIISRKPTDANNPVLYFHAFPYSYFKNTNWDFKLDIFVWRSISVPFSKIYMHKFLGGKKLLKAIYNWENKHPETAGRFGQYPLLVITKHTSNK
jgi:ubiquinone/menaquinone biosynthesis C-methylase UbiE/uncharacterized protein YbaR (Trm112 family)